MAAVAGGGPQEGAELAGHVGGQKQRGRRQRQGGGEPHQRAPVERQAKPGLGPPGDPLHEGIGRDQGQRADAQQDGDGRQGQKDRQTDQAARHHEGPGLFDADPAGRNGPLGGAGDLGVEVAIHDVVEGATRRPHQTGADSEADEQPQIIETQRLPILRQGQGDPLPAGQQQQPDADGPVEPPQLQPGFQPLRRMAVHPVGAGVGKGGGGHGDDLAVLGRGVKAQGSVGRQKKRGLVGPAP